MKDLRLVFYVALFLLFLEVVLLGVAGFENSAIYQILVSTYYVVTLLIYMFAMAIKVNVLFFTLQWSAGVDAFESIFYALYLILLVVFGQSIDVLIQLMASPFLLFGQSVYDAIIETLQAVLPAINIDVQVTVQSLFKDQFGVNVDIPFPLKISIAAGALAKAAQEVANKQGEAAVENAKAYNSLGELLFGWLRG